MPEAIAKEVQKSIVELYQAGHRVKDVANLLSISGVTVTQYVRKAGISPRSLRGIKLGDTKKSWPKEKIEQMISYYQQGKNQRELAEIFGCTDSAIRHYFTKYKVPRKKWKYEILHEGIPLTTFLRNCNTYSTWRRDVYSRDSFLCQICGSNNKLEAHHIIAFAYLLKKNNINSYEEALSCSELWEVSNGQTLCRSCHKETDNYAGKAIPFHCNQ